MVGDFIPKDDWNNILKLEKGDRIILVVAGGSRKSLNLLNILF